MIHAENYFITETETKETESDIVFIVIKTSKTTQAFVNYGLFISYIEKNKEQHGIFLKKIVYTNNDETSLVDLLYHINKVWKMKEITMDAFNELMQNAFPISADKTLLN